MRQHFFCDDGGFKPDPRTEVKESVDDPVHRGKVKLHQAAATRGLKICMILDGKGTCSIR